MYSRNKVIEDHKDYIVEQYKNTNITQVEIAKSIGVASDTLTRYAKKWGLKKAVKTKMTQQSKEWLKRNYQLPYSELREYTGCCDEVIRQALLSMGIHRNTPYRPFKLDMDDEEFLSDLDNPRLCAPDIVKKYKDKYGIGESRVHQLRKERGIKLQVNTLKRTSGAECSVQKILDSLDLAYIKEKSFGKYHVDFYLGFKTCIEVQGRYWHSSKNRIITDNRKKDYLNGFGIQVIYIWDDELDNARDLIVSTLQKQGLPMQ